MNSSKQLKRLQISILIVLFAALSFFSFSGKGDYTLLENGKVIKKGFDTYYQVGMIIIKFKNFNNTFSKSMFNYPKLDNLLQSYSVLDIKQNHPLNQNVSKRKIGDEELAKIFTIKYDAGIDPFDLAEKIVYQNPDVIDWAEPSFVYKADFIPNDPVISGQWHIQKINAYQAWDLNQGDTTIVIGIVDSGTDFDHPDLAANMKINWLENPTNGIDDDGNGYIDDWRGWDFWGSDNNPQIQPSGNVHGSHVSGCASQVTNNNVHGAGIGFKTKILMTKHTDDTNPESSLYYTDNGIVYQYTNGAKVINCSYGSSSYSAYSQLVINNAWSNGTVICASAGNGDANGVGQNWARYPASYDHVVSVAATTSTDAKTGFSNFHSTVDVCAPGQSILSTVYNDSYTNFDGTSMSSPITAGTVALIRAKYPSWTAQQVVDRLLVGVDSIYNLNPSYVGLLGTGRVNAFKCLSELPIARVLSFSHNDSLYGNNDKVYDVNEIIPIAINFKNTHFAGTNASIRLTTTNPDIEIVQDSVYIGNIPAYGNFNTTFANTFKVKAKSTCPFDKDVTFKVSSSASVYTDDNANTFVIRFRQGYATHNANNLKISMTNDGAIGKKAQSYGNGLFLGSGTVNQIYESGLMIGLSNTKVSDVCRRGTSPANVSDTDFYALKSYTITNPGPFSSQYGNGKFNDNNAGANMIGVEVIQDSYEFTTANDSNYILIKYSIKNTNSTALSNVYAGIFTAFSPNSIFASGNITRYNATNKIGYTYNTSTPNPYLGVALMTDQNINFKAITLADIMNGFTTQEKWDVLSNGIVNDSIGPGGNCFGISVGPLNLAANQTVAVGFAVVVGNDLNDLFNKTTIARTKYASTISIKPISENIPMNFELMQNYPNPFNPVTTIKFAIAKPEFVKIKIYDMLGKEIAILVNEKLNPGYYDVKFDASNLSSGVYFYRIETNTFTDLKKMILLK